MINVGDIFHTSRGGDVVVVRYNNAHSVEVRFLNTDYSTVTSSQYLRLGKVRDPFSPTVFGVGFIGFGKYRSMHSGVRSKAHIKWSGMLERCYSERYQSKKPTYKGCVVCDEWHNFQNFADWYYSNCIDGFELDKDKLGNGKIYSPETCCFMSRSENIEISQSQLYMLRSKEGELVTFFNLSKFCRDNNLTPANIHKVLNGTRNHHKGWRAP